MGPLPGPVTALLGTGLALLAWETVGRLWLGTERGLPPPSAVLTSVYRDGWAFYLPLLQATASRALPGYLVGNGIALALAVLVLLVPALERVVMQVAVTTYCLPVLAVGPILTITLTGDQPMAALAGLAVAFTTLVGALLGLRSADPLSLDLVRVYGGGRLQQLLRVRLVAALPSTLAALRIAAPASVLGAVIGEFLGGSSNVGLGFALITSEQQLEVARTWGIALAAAVLAGAGYALTGLIARVSTPWAAETTTAAGAA